MTFCKVMQNNQPIRRIVMTNFNFNLETSQTVPGKHLLATRAFKSGELIYRIENFKRSADANYQTIQVGPNEHIEELGALAYLNHSCNPGVIVNTSELTVRACRAIAAGEELNFFYPSTEWKMDRPFICLCGAPQCIRLVAGAFYVSLDVLGRYFINTHIREMAAGWLEASTNALWKVLPHETGNVARDLLEACEVR